MPLLLFSELKNCTKVDIMRDKLRHVELPPNEDVITRQQNARVKRSRGNPINRQRHYVGAAGVIVGYLFALFALCLWLLRLLGVIHL